MMKRTWLLEFGSPGFESQLYHYCEPITMLKLIQISESQFLCLQNKHDNETSQVDTFLNSDPGAWLSLAPSPPSTCPYSSLLNKT